MSSDNVGSNNKIVPLQGALNDWGGGAVGITCSRYSGTVLDGVKLVTAELSAIKVGTIH